MLRTSASAETQMTSSSHSSASCAGVVAAMQTEFGRERRGFSAGAVPEAVQQPGAMQIAGHGAPMAPRPMKPTCIDKLEAPAQVGANRG